jgi:arylsulfatase A-like enzyme/Flp pilus assembly protein TadD
MTMFSRARLAILTGFLVQGLSTHLSAGEDPRSLLLITIDTLRADYLSCNGSEKVETPNLDRLAENGVNFTRARTAVPLTLPAHASILTGSYPPVHGVRDNGSYRLPGGERTLAEILEERGYETAAFVGAFVLDRRFGLAQGFDLYDDQIGADVSMLENLEAERDADAVVEAFTRWLDRYEGEKPFFAWVHLYDPHAPYAPPEPYRSRYADDLYAGEVAFADAAVGKVVAGLRSKKILGSTLVAVVGDHGEGLGEHEEQTHSMLIHNSTLHVPMLLHAPGLVPTGKEIPHLARIIDLAPTLLDYLGIAPSLGQGTSLRPLVGNESLGDELTAYSESLYPRLNLGWSELRAIESGKYRFILAPREELYDLSEDPGETVNLIDSLPEVATDLRRRLEEMIEAVDSADDTARRPIDAETQAMLESLGYLSTAGGRAKPGDASVDPKDKMGIWNQIQFGLFLFARGNYVGALEILMKVLASEPNMPILYSNIGSCYMRLEQHPEAERIYRRALERGIESADFHVDLGVIYYRRGDLEKAEGELQIAIALKEHSVPAHYRLGDVYRAGKRYPDAVAHYRKALEINPHYVYAVNGLGMALAMQGKSSEALRAFREVVRENPVGARGYINLAIQLERMERNEEALEAYREFMSLADEEEFARERKRAAAAIERLR